MLVAPVDTSLILIIYERHGWFSRYIHMWLLVVMPVFPQMTLLNLKENSNHDSKPYLDSFKYYCRARAFSNLNCCAVFMEQMMKKRPIIPNMVTSKVLSIRGMQIIIIIEKLPKLATAENLRPIISSPQIDTISEGNSKSEYKVNVQKIE